MRGYRAQEGGRQVVMTNNKLDVKTRYELLISGLVVLVLCILAFSIYRATQYTRANVQAGPVIAETNSDGTVLIEVEISQETEPTEETLEDPEAVSEEELLAELYNEHDDIMIFTTTTAGNNYYKSRDGRIALYYEPKETDGEVPSLQEDYVFEVLGFSRDGWAAIWFGGTVCYVKSADLVLAAAPEDAIETHVDPESTQSVRFFTPQPADSIEYVVKSDCRAFNLPDVMSSGNTVDLKTGERVIVVATCGAWNKIIYMNAEYYVLSYLTPRDEWIGAHPEEPIVDNTGYAPAGSEEAAASAMAASGAADANPADVAEGSSEGDSGSGDAGTGDEGSGSDSSGSGSSTVPGYVQYSYELLDYVNAERVAAGLEPLVWSDTLAGCAGTRAAELPMLSDSQNTNHLRPDGSEWYTVNPDAMWAENIAYGQRSAWEVHTAWMNSSGHYENLMNPDYRTFGAAVYVTDSGYVYYWIEEFGY